VNLIIEITLDKKGLEGIGIDEDELLKIVKKRIKNYDVEIEEEKLILKSKKEDSTIKDLQKAKLKVFDLKLGGISGIEQAMVTKEGNEWVITTIGSNIKKALKIEGIDTKRITSNDIKEIEKIFGIEAARNSIINEACGTLADQGLDIDARHIVLVGDMMTITGRIKAIGRYGIAGSKKSVLARANFETTVKHLTNAAVEGHVDKLNSMVENILMNQVAPIGTCLCDVVFKPSVKKKK